MSSATGARLHHKHTKSASQQTPQQPPPERHPPADHTCPFGRRPPSPPTLAGLPCRRRRRVPCRRRPGNEGRPRAGYYHSPPAAPPIGRSAWMKSRARAARLKAQRRAGRQRASADAVLWAVPSRGPVRERWGPGVGRPRRCRRCCCCCPAELSRPWKVSWSWSRWRWWRVESDVGLMIMVWWWWMVGSSGYVCDLRCLIDRDYP